jgi:DNA polymerase family A
VQIGNIAGEGAAPRALPYDEINCVDFEYFCPDGENPLPLCMSVFEVRTGRHITYWRDQLGAAPPFSLDPRALYVSYSAAAELRCHIQLGWPMPARTLDLFAEFRALTNGLYYNKKRQGSEKLPGKGSMLKAMQHYGLSHMSVDTKDAGRDLAKRGGIYTLAERQTLMQYCAGDTESLARLLAAMVPEINLAHGLIRGRFAAALARMETVGIPIEVGLYTRLLHHWPTIQRAMIRHLDTETKCYDGQGSFSVERFLAFLESQGIAGWPTTDTGLPRLDGRTLKDASIAYPVLGDFYRLREQLGKTRPVELKLGSDGRNRTSLTPFHTITGRNQPSPKEFIFYAPAHLRSLAKPPPGYGLAYIDYAQQEFAIAAFLSGDPAMIAAYRSGDCYLTFAIQAGVIPMGSTRKDLGVEEVRERFKKCVLGIAYGIGPETLAWQAKVSIDEAGELLRLHRQAYPVFWTWYQAVIDGALMHNEIETCLGWRYLLTTTWRGQERPNNFRSLGNFMMQAHGGEVLRLACCLATEAGVDVAAPVHDALLIVAPIDRLERDIEITREAMAEASRQLFDGAEIRTDDAKAVLFPDRYVDGRGKNVWDIMMVELEIAEAA